MKIFLTALIHGINSFIFALGRFIDFIFVLLPNSPFRGYMNFSLDSEYWGMLNYVLPFSESLAVLELWISAVAIYYMVVIPLRYVRAIK